MVDNVEWDMVCCCIPRFFLGLFLACYFFFTSLGQILKWTIIFIVRRSASLTPIHCSGFKCNDVLTCDATKEATYHVRMVWSFVGGLIFGYLGIFGVWNRQPANLHYFSLYLLSFSMLLCVLFLADAWYLGTCGGFTYNVIEEAVLWPNLYGLFPDVPVPIGVKMEVQSMDMWPPAYVDHLTFLKVWKVYAVCVLSRALLWYLVYREMAMLARYEAFGMLGLGPTYSLRAWREKEIVKLEFGKQWQRMSADVEAIEEQLEEKLPIEFLEDDLFGGETSRGPGGYGVAAPAKASTGKGKVNFKRLAGQLAGV